MGESYPSEEMQSVYSAAAAYCHPSKYWTGLSLLKSWAYNVDIIQGFWLFITWRGNSHHHWHMGAVFIKKHSWPTPLQPIPSSGVLPCMPTCHHIIIKSCARFLSSFDDFMLPGWGGSCLKTIDKNLLDSTSSYEVVFCSSTPL